jgi:hypothetical protein
MKNITALMFAGLSFFGSIAAAQAAQADTPAVTQYSYGTKLDIAKVVQVSRIPNVCGVVPATMVYIDHAGEQHKLQYEVMGRGCADS